ncbi:MAG: beta-N-acetylhexosaminidase [Alphaproteobacteria bacterium]
MSLSDAKAVIFSCEGLELSSGERVFFKEANPLGFILFARNCENPAQVRALTDDLRETLGRNCPVLIDQEGGRVQRLKPPVWRQYPPMRSFGDKAVGDMDGALEALRFTILQMAEELSECGVNVNCAPVMDVLTDATHDAIGDRAFSNDPQVVGRLGLSVCRHFLAAGITPVIKHIPGHGRGKVDSHKGLPRVSASLEDLRGADFDPFRIVSKATVGGLVWGMVAHIVYEKIDPEHPASVSSDVIQKIIREDIGFEGFLLSDDLDMEALAGYGEVAARAVLSIEAGCDAALYCAGDLGVMEKIAEIVPNLSQKAQKRLQKAAGMTNMAA